MDNSIRNDRLSKNLKKFFAERIKQYYITELEIIITTKEGNFHKMDIKSEEYYQFLLIDDEEKIEQYIESTIIEILYKKNIKNISYGYSHVFVKTFDNEIYCWGGNTFGQMGNGTINENIEIPQLNRYLSEKNISEITCGYYHSLALTESGDIFAWGDNKMGQIGDGSDEKYQCQPIKLNKFDSEKVVAISCGAYHSMCLTDVGHVWSWGSNEYGQLGNEDSSISKTPKIINLKNITIQKICCGRNHNLLLSTDGYILTYGSNGSGQLGDGSTKIKTHPSKLLNLELSKDISSYLFDDISVSLSIDDIFYAWGKCGNEIEMLPKRKNSNSFDQIFFEFSKICTEPMKEIPFVEDNFIYNGFFERTFSEISEIGAGSFGTVFKVENKLTHSITAVKKIESLKEESDFLKEFKIFRRLLNLKSNHIVSYFECWFENEQDYSANKLSLYIQMELCERTLNEIMNEMKNNLDFMIDKNLTALGSYICSEIFLEILEGVNFLHKQNPQLIHRDLKPDNILLKKSPSKNWIKIADFGLLAYHENSNKKHSMDKGDVKYMAPEVGRGSDYNTKVDIFSLGIIFKKMFKISKQESYENINLKRLDHKYKNRRDLFFQMKNENSEQRPDCDEIINNKVKWASSEQELNNLKEQDFKTKEKSKCFILSYLKSKLKIKEMDEISSTYEQKQMIDNLIADKRLLSFQVAKTMLSVDRKLFCPTTEKDPYEDEPKEIGYGTKISAPSIHALILELLRKHVKNGSKILDIGSGIGYLTTCLAQISDSSQVISIEHVKNLADESKLLITKYFPSLMGRIKIINQDGSKGYQIGAPYRAINVGFALTHVPEEMMTQLEIGGRMIVPLEFEDGKQKLTTIDKLLDGSIEQKFHENVKFKLIDVVSHQTE